MKIRHARSISQKIAWLALFSSLSFLGCSVPEEPTSPTLTEAKLALVRPGQVDAVREILAATESESAVEHAKVGWYLREIHGKTLLLRYSGNPKGGELDEALYESLAPHISPIRENIRGDKVFESMERIFFEPGADGAEAREAKRRTAMITELRPEKEAWYRMLHANPWPNVTLAIQEANTRDFSIFLEEVDGRLYLFGWLEYVGDDSEADSAANSRDATSIRWWRETDACQIPPPEVEKGSWGSVQELRFGGVPK